jgi:Taurine catabolism dioxygenase TauD, TfdA family
MPIQPLEAHAAWRHVDVIDETQWTVVLDDADKAELDAALRHARGKSHDLLEIAHADFPLEALAAKLKDVERELIDGRGFVRISALDRDRYTGDEMTMMHWGIGMHLGNPWPQNKHGHVMGDVTDQGKRRGDPTARGNEMGLIALDYHTDGSDQVGLMCLHPAKSGGLSCVANVVAIYNELAVTRPEIIAPLFDNMPWDFRGEEAPGGKPYYMRNVFTEYNGRLFCRFVPAYIKSSQRHDDAPRLSAKAVTALDTIPTWRNARNSMSTWI